MIELNKIHISKNGRDILKVNHLMLKENELTVILGHNGSGKSTLMKVASCQITPDKGEVFVDGKNIKKISPKKLAKKIALLPQELPSSIGLTVQELVSLGRFPWQNFFGREDEKDKEIIFNAIQNTKVEIFKNTLIDQLSGGERQRAWISMLLAQKSPMLLLDEPVSALDLFHQYEIMSLLKDIAHKKKNGIVVILHDINLACRFADRIIALKKGEILFDESPSELLKENKLDQLYEVKIELLDSSKHKNKIAIVAENYDHL